MACKHADLMAVYAKQAAEMNEPWKLWRLREHEMNPWFYPNSHFVFSDCFEYEQIPKTININGFSVPEPMQKKPETGRTYYTVDAAEEYGIYGRLWENDIFDSRAFGRGICHLTRENAIIHAKALFSFTEVKW